MANKRSKTDIDVSVEFNRIELRHQDRHLTVILNPDGTFALDRHGPVTKMALKVRESALKRDAMMDNVEDWIAKA
jgi:hypothetical protein